MTHDLSRGLPRASRRTLLGAAAALSTAGLLGCQFQTKPDAGPTPAGPGGAKITFPPPQTQLPQDDVTYRIMVSDGNNVLPPVWDAFHKAHPNITMDAPPHTWDTINETVTLGVRNGTAPDLFSRPTTVPMSIAVKNGWAAPLEDVIPDFDKWKSAYPDTAFIPGIHVFDGKTYGWTYFSNRNQYGYWLFFDQKLMNKVDEDPTQISLTWDAFRALAKKITKKGGKDTYGLALAGKRLGGLGRTAVTLAELAGLVGDEFNDKTGEYQQTDPLITEAVELILAIKSDGSLMPGALSLSPKVSIPRMTQGTIGMQLQGSWCIAKWRKDDPSWQYGVAMPPTGNDGVFHHAAFAEGTAAPVIAYAKSKLTSVTGELLSYLGSVDGQTELALLSHGDQLSEIPEANKRAREQGNFPEPVKATQAYAEKLLVERPQPQIANPDTGQVTVEERKVKPTLDDIVQGVFTGDIKVNEMAKHLQKLQDDSNRELDRAIKAARKKGADVSRADFTFSNWDPEKDYTMADYKSKS